MSLKRKGYSTFELLLLGMFGALVVVANLALRFPIKAPGHSGVVWMALLVTARSVVPRPAAGTTAALFSAALAAFLGLGDKGALDTFLSYTAAGVGVDVIAALLPRPGSAVACVAAGVLGNLLKLGVKTALELWIGIPTGFVLLGRLYPAATYTLFGLAGGYLGFLVLTALRGAGFFAYLAERR
jgi:hypothetical protein